MSIPAPAFDTARKLLVGTTAEQVLAARNTNHGSPEPTLLRSTATVSQALTELAKRHILSAPVVVAPVPGAPYEPGDPTWPSGSPSGDNIGFVDIRDILCSFLHEVKGTAFEGMKLLNSMRILEEEGSRFGNTQLGALPELGQDGGFMHCSQTKACLLEVIMFGLLDTKSRGLHEGSKQLHVAHRIAFFDKAGCIRNIMSQTDVVRFLAEHLDELGPVCQETVSALGMVCNNVQTVLPETSAIVALRHMQEMSLSALAVTDYNGRLIGNFSVSDLRCITPQQFGALALPVGEFLAMENRIEYVGHNRIHEEGVAGTTGHRFVTEFIQRAHPRVLGEDLGQELVLCNPGDTFGTILTKIVRHRIHRLYVIDAEEKPVGIITCTDILRKLVEPCSPP